MLFSTNFCTPSEAEEQIDAYLCEVPDEEDESPEFSEEQRELCRERVKAVLDQREEIDGILQQASSGWSLRQMGRVELTILRLACFELRFDENIPEKVAINEAVELAKKFGGEEAPSFVNGVLAKLV
jgi:transcription antitermination factor nusB